MREQPVGTPLLVYVTTVAQSLDVFFEGQIPYLRSKGFRVAGVCAPGPLADQARAHHGIEVHTIPLTRGLTPLRDLLALASLYRLFRRLRPTIVHSHTPKAGLVGSLAAWLARVPVRVYTIHGLRFETLRGTRRMLLVWAERASCRLAHRILAVSDSLMRRCVTLRVATPERMAVLGAGSVNGVNSRRFSRTDALRDAAEVRRRLEIPEDALVAGYVGRIVRDKGCMELAQAWKGIRVKVPNAHLVLVGETEVEDPVPAPVLDGLRSDAKVHFAGRQSDVVPYYAAFDVLMLPTYREGFPLVALEAAAMEVPVVATRVTGCVDAVVDGVTGVLLPVKDADGIERAVTELLANPELRRRIGTAARERVLREFRPERIWEELLEVYRGLLAALAPRRQCGWYRRGGKRAIDVLISSAALCLVWPLMAVIAVAIRLTMGSPVLFRQARPGLHERIFQMLKFRTMTEACGPDGEQLAPETRVTWLGRLLRTMSLDELPELWNVLRGDMSLVGPRPWLPKYLPLYSDFQKRRHEVPPGITGLAQVSGRNRLSWEERIALDVWYVDHGGFLTDCAIVARTVWRVVARKDVGEGGATTSQAFQGDAACADGRGGRPEGATAE